MNAFGTEDAAYHVMQFTSGGSDFPAMVSHACPVLECDGISVCSSREDGCISVGGESKASSGKDMYIEEISSDEDIASPPEVFERPTFVPEAEGAEDTVQPITDDFLHDLIVLGCPIVLIPFIKLLAKCVEAP